MNTDFHEKLKHRICLLIHNYFISIRRGVGCIFFEMVSGRPMFPGSTAENELTLIFKMLGTPNDRNWPGILQNQSFVEGICN